MITKKQCEDLIFELLEPSGTECGVLVELEDDSLKSLFREYSGLEGRLWEITNVHQKYITVRDHKNKYLYADSWESRDVKRSLGHPILLGNVLKKTLSTSSQEPLALQKEIMILWGACGFTPCLQQIYKDIEWEAIASSTRADAQVIFRAKPSPATDLFTFLISLNFKN